MIIKKDDYLLFVSFVIAALIVAAAWIYTWGFNLPRIEKNIAANEAVLANNLVAEILPDDGVVLPARWGDLGVKLLESGTIDGKKFEALYAGGGGLDGETKNLLYGRNNGNIKITPENSGIILNLLWALGLGNKNEILEKGPMADPRYGGGGNFASTGGWTLADGSAMNHYSKHGFITLTPEQQKLVDEVSKNIYRPCCGNSTYFPDCNHGMAMLALLELMASQNVSEIDMYKAALLANSYWFPDTYLTIAKYLKEKKNISWENADPKEILGSNYSSAAGYQNILRQVTPPATQSGGGCGI